MPMNIPDAPAASVDSLAAALARPSLRPYLARVAPALAAAAPGAAPAAAVTPSLSYSVHVMGLDQVAAGESPAQARLVAWRHLLPAAGQKVLAAEVTVDRQTGEHRFAALNDGPFAAAVQAEVAKARQDPAVSSGNYDLAVLQIPAMHVVAVWLRGRGGQADILIPVAPTHPALTAGRHYGADELVKALQPAAQAKLADDHPAKGS